MMPGIGKKRNYIRYIITISLIIILFQFFIGNVASQGMPYVIGGIITLDGVAVEGAHINVKTGMGEYNTTSIENGKYGLGIAIAGFNDNVTVTATYDGLYYGRNTLLEQTGTITFVNLELKPGQPPIITTTPIKTYSIYGIVTCNDKAAAGATVNIFLHGIGYQFLYGSGIDGCHLTTGVDGLYECEIPVYLQLNYAFWYVEVSYENSNSVYSTVGIEDTTLLDVDCLPPTTVYNNQYSSSGEPMLLALYSNNQEPPVLNFVVLLLCVFVIIIILKKR